MPNFFIDRPIFAWVIAIIIMLAGWLGDYRSSNCRWRNIRRLRRQQFPLPPCTPVLTPKRCRTP